MGASAALISPRRARLASRILASLALAFAALAPAPAATTITVALGLVSGTGGGGQCSLIDAIKAANTDAAVGGCPAGDGDDVIRLAAGTYTLTAADNYWYCPNGLPPVATAITIVGDPDGSTIERSSAAGTPAFRLGPWWLLLGGLAFRWRWRRPGHRS